MNRLKFPLRNANLLKLMMISVQYNCLIVCEQVVQFSQNYKAMYRTMCTTTLFVETLIFRILSDV